MDLETQCDFVQKGKAYNIKQGMVFIEGGPFTMGSEDGPDNEIPKRESMWTVSGSTAVR